MMFNSMKYVALQNGLLFFSKAPLKLHKVLYVSVESFERNKVGIHNNLELARELATKNPSVSKPTALARLMLHDMFKYIELSIEWREKAYPHEDNLFTIITTPEGMFHTPPAEEFMLTQEVFQKELILPMKEYLRKLSSSIGVNFGTFGVLIAPADKNFKPENYIILSTKTPSMVSQNAITISNEPPDVSERFMHAAIYGSGGPNSVVDYYTKQNVWHGDNYKDIFLQMYDSTKPYILIQDLDGNKFARVLRICVDSSFGITDEQIHKLLMQMGAHELPDFGVVEILSFRGNSPQPSNVIYSKVFVSEANSVKLSGIYDMKDNVQVQSRIDFIAQS